MAVAAGVLIVDDSALTREALKLAIESDGSLKVCGEARSGEEAILLARSLKPALITMDLNMPGMGGLQAIEAIMKERPTPIVVISERSSSVGFDVNYEALSRGAIDLIPKSGVFGSARDGSSLLIERLKQMAGGRMRVRAKPVATTPVTASKEMPVIVGIGASTGGPKALVRVLSDLPSHFPLPVAVVQHMADDFFESFVRFLGDASKKDVRIAVAGKPLQPGVVTVAPSRQEMFITPELTVRLMPAPPEALISPTVDSLFSSLASAFHGRSIGVLLTGMGEDGAQGLLRMRKAGARTIVQDKSTSTVFGMPRAAIELGAAEVVSPLDSIAQYIAQTAGAPIAAPKAKVVAVIDDQVSEVAETRRLLEGQGFSVRVFDNPLTAVAEMRRAEIDVVLIEANLKSSSCEAVLTSLRSGRQNMSVLLMSKLEAAALKKKATELKVDGFVKKSSRTLGTEVTAFLDRLKRPSA